MDYNKHSRGSGEDTANVDYVKLNLAEYNRMKKIVDKIEADGVVTYHISNTSRCYISSNFRETIYSSVLITTDDAVKILTNDNNDLYNKIITLDNDNKELNNQLNSLKKSDLFKSNLKEKSLWEILKLKYGK